MSLTILLPLLITGLLLIFISLRLRSKTKSKELVPIKNNDLQILEILVPKSMEVTKETQMQALPAENMFASLHGLLTEDADSQEHFSFEISSEGGRGTRFFVAVPGNIIKFVESQIYAQYPSSQVRVSEDYMKENFSEGTYEISSLILSKDYFFPIKTFRDFESDPLSAVLSALAEVSIDESLWVQVLVKPIADGWQNMGYDYVNSVRTGTVSNKKGSPLGDLFKTITSELFEIGLGILLGLFIKREDPKYAPKDAGKPALPPKLTSTQELEIKSIENKLGKMGFEVEIRVLSRASDSVKRESNLRSFIAAFKQFSFSTLNGFSAVRVNDKVLTLEKFKDRIFDEERSFILNVEELASIYHLPSAQVETPNISWVYSKKAEPPAGLPTQNCCYIGETMFRSQRVRFGLANNDDRLRHMYLIGKSGTGKSTLFESMISQDIKNGFGVGVLDPHGETIDKVLEYIPDNRIDDVIYFDPSDTERPVGLNLLEMNDQSQKNLMASALVAAIKHHFDYSWGPRMEYLLNYCFLTLLEVPGTSLLGVTRLLEDDNYLKYILHNVKDPVVIKFWENEYKNMKGNQKLVTESISPIQNKVNRFLASTTIRNILGQKKSTIDIWEAMNSGKILLMNLSKGKIGEDNANLLGALLVSRIQFMALQRAKIPSQERRPFYLYVDEFQNFATGSFESILSESRKYGLGLYLTHQYTAQLPEQLLKAVFGNVGTIATYSLGAPDARALASEFAPYFDEEDIISLERFHIYIKLMMNGMTSLPFSARILIPWVPGESIVPKTPNKQRVMELSRQKYGSDRIAVETKINKWVETPFDKGMAIAQANRSSQEPTEGQIDLKNLKETINVR